MTGRLLLVRCRARSHAQWRKVVSPSRGLHPSAAAHAIGSYSDTAMKHAEVMRAASEPLPANVDPIAVSL